MVIGLFGESCTGKSTLADALAPMLGAEVYTGKDYLKLAKNEADARRLFVEKLTAADSRIIYVISEKEHLPLLPEDALRVLVTADIAVIKERFAKRMRGNLPAPVAAMLERKHGCFDNEPHDLHVVPCDGDCDAICAGILSALASRAGE